MKSPHQCTQYGCDSPAVWEMALQFLTIGGGFFRVKLRANTTVRVCGDHMQAAQARLLSPANKERIARLLLAQNMPLPDFTSFEVLWNRVDHDGIDAELANEVAGAERENDRHRAIPGQP